MTLVACSRMYNVAPGARAAWDDLFEWLARASGTRLDVIDHPAPLPLAGLWGRADLGAAFMCGWPFVTTPDAMRPQPVATLLPAAPWAEGRACYASHLLTRDDTGIEHMSDAAGRRLGWTVRDSQSGYHALRHHLVSDHALATCTFETVGPLLNPGGVIAALRAGEIDIGAVDTYAHSLIERYAPDDLTGLRILATTSLAPAPLLVAGHDADPHAVDSLRRALVGMSDASDTAHLLDALCLNGFAHVPTVVYAELIDRHAETTEMPDW